MRCLSLRDIKLHPKLVGLNEVQCIHPEMDVVMEQVLEELGYDVEYPVIYQASNHRDMQGKVAIGFQAIGELIINRNVVNSGMYDLFEVIATTGYSDLSLTQELAKLQNTSMKYTDFIDEETGGALAPEDFPECLKEPDEEFILIQIKQLNDIRDALRGNMYKEDGSLKCFEDYAYSVPE